MTNLESMLELEAVLAKARKAANVEAALALVELWAAARFRDRRRKLTAELRAAAKELRQAGDVYSEIADKLGLSLATARRACLK